MRRYIQISPSSLSYLSYHFPLNHINYDLTMVPYFYLTQEYNLFWNILFRGAQYLYLNFIQDMIWSWVNFRTFSYSNIYRVEEGRGWISLQPSYSKKGPTWMPNHSFDSFLLRRKGSSTPSLFSRQWLLGSIILAKKILCRLNFYTDLIIRVTWQASENISSIFILHLLNNDIWVPVNCYIVCTEHTGHLEYFRTVW